MFYQSNCIDECPDSTYEDNSNVCIDCDGSPGVDCATCDFADTNCTSCLGGLYLSAPTFGTCGSACGGSYPWKDTVNFKCVQSCADNLIPSTDGSQTCTLCAFGTYKKISDGLCHASCGATFF